MRLVAVEGALWIAAAIAVLVAGLGWARAGSPKVLEIGSVVVFTAVAGFAAVSHWSWTLIAVRLAVDCGLLLIVVFSLAIDRPFTLQYAREQTPPEVWNTPLFLAVNRRVTWVWATALAALVASHAAVVFVPRTPGWVDAAVTVAALFGATRFTVRYPEAVRQRVIAATGG
jgi:hypothetical protein